MGVAGFVGLLPYAKAATATVQSMGTLEQFYVDTVDRNRMVRGSSWTRGGH